MTSRPSDHEIRASVAGRARLVRDTVAFIHGHPELPHEERASAQHLQDVLGGLGLDVEPGLAGMATGFRATLTGAAPGRTVGIVALYDAVASVPPQGGIVPVHSCGHGPIAGSVVGAIAGLAEHRPALSGRVVVMGCPADEIHAPGTVSLGSGKARSAEAGAWDDVDAALYAHPEYIDTVSQASLWMRRIEVRVSGTRSLAEGAEHPPLDAVRNGIAVVRSLPAGRAILEHIELDGDVEEGGGLVTRMTFLVWAEDEPGLEALAGPLSEAVPAGTWSVLTTVPSITPDPRVTAAVADAFAAAGRPFVADPPALPFATDFGAVSRRVPSALIGVGRPGGWAFHTPAGATEFASEDGFAAAMTMAEVLALSAARLTAAR
jgi:metal-dependent amidase/aminoacylase/carboxypeptidase family protein